MAMRALFLHDQGDAHGLRPPAALAAKEFRNETALSIEGGQEVLQVPDAGLDLTDEERSAGGMPCQAVHGASFAK